MPESPVQSEGFDKTSFLAALALIGAGMVSLLTMMMLLFPEWVPVHAFAAETESSPIHVVTLRAPSILSRANVSAITPSTVSSARTVGRPSTNAIPTSAREGFPTTRFSLDPLENGSTPASDTGMSRAERAAILKAEPLPGLDLTISVLPDATVPTIGVSVSVPLPATPVTPAAPAASVTVSPKPGVEATVPAIGPVDTKTAPDPKEAKEDLDKALRDIGLKLP